MHDLIIAPNFWSLLEAVRRDIPPTVREVHERQKRGGHDLPCITQVEAGMRIGRQWRSLRVARSANTIAAALTALHGGSAWSVVQGPGWCAGGPSAAILDALRPVSREVTA